MNITDFPTIGYHRGYEIKEIPAGNGSHKEDLIVLWDSISQHHVSWEKHTYDYLESLDIAAYQLDCAKTTHTTKP